MDYVTTRLPRDRSEKAFGDILQNMDAAIEVVDDHDTNMYKEGIKEAAAKDEAIDQFKLEYARTRAEVVEMLPKQTKKSPRQNQLHSCHI